MTDINVTTVPLQSENLAWDMSSPGVAFRDSGTLDPALFNAAQHYPNGYLKSGLVLGKVTATGKLGPYLSSASDGRQTAVGHLAASIQVINPITGAVKGALGVSVMKAFGVVKEAALPYTSGNAALGGYVDTAAKTALARIQYV